MKKQTRSILEEIGNMVPAQDRAIVVESRANHVINSAINLIDMIHENFDPDIALELERRFVNSIKGKDAKKFQRGIRKHQNEGR
jgi:uncharacterized Fe-S cluster-containing MiaB family protein